MKSIRVSIPILADTESVFRVVSDYANLDQVIPEITKIEFLTDGPVGAGTRFRETRLVSKKSHTEELVVAEFDPVARRSVLECESMGSLFRTELSVTSSEADRCEVTLQMEVKALHLLASGMWLLIGPMTHRMMTNALKKDLEHIRDFVTGVSRIEPPSDSSD